MERYHALSIPTVVYDRGGIGFASNRKQIIDYFSNISKFVKLKYRFF